MKIHPVCLAFPDMAGPEFDELVESLKDNGLKTPITTHRGFIVDGKNRFRACKEAGVEPSFVEWDGVGSLVDWAVSQNLHRRNLTASQKAAVAADLVPIHAQEAESRKKAGKTLPPVGGKVVNCSAAKAAAASTGTSERSVERAVRVAKSAPEKIEQVRAGTKTLRAAEREIKAEKAADEAPPVDGLGRPVADKSLWEDFRSTAHDELVSTLRKAKAQAKAICDLPIGAFLHAQQIEADLSNAMRAVKWSKPHAPCVYCRAGCKACKQRRWLPRALYESAPENMK